MLAEQQVKVLLEFYPLLRLYARVEKYLKKQHLLCVLRHFPHLDQALVNCVNEPADRVEVL